LNIVSGINITDNIKEQVEGSGVVEGTYLHSLANKLCVHLVNSRSDNTNKVYLSAFKRWEKFIKSQGFPALPGNPVHVALYISHLLDSGASYNVVNVAVYYIKWAHDLNGFADPTCNAFVKNLQDTARCCFRPRIQRKDPVTSDILIRLCKMFESNVVHDLCMTLLSYAGFLRYDEISSLVCSDVRLFDKHISLNIRKSKTDQYRKGHEVLIACGETIACPVRMLKKYLDIAHIDLSSDQFLFKAVYRSKDKCGLIYKNKKISYNAAKTSIISKLKLVEKDLNFGLHSMRAGGATSAANSATLSNDRCWKRHGRWKRWLCRRLS
jgi:integrase